MCLSGTEGGSDPRWYVLYPAELFSGQSSEIFGKSSYRFFLGGPGGDKTDRCMGVIDFLLILEFIGFPQFFDKVNGKNGELLVCGGIGEEGESAVLEGLF